MAMLILLVLLIFFAALGIPLAFAGSYGHG